MKNWLLLVFLATGLCAVGAASDAVAATQTIAAGTSATNLPTETTWPGAQNPPYVCCWNQQGQFVTFTFNVAAGSTSLTLRYSAGHGQASRKVELDGVISVANQTFPATASWSTWSTVSLNRTLTAGTHTLKVWFDSTAGSTNYLNLDNLTVAQGTTPPPSVRVSVGYADGAAGLTPWSGSPGTIFVGEPGQCCLTHGPDNGSAGYDGGAIEVANPGSTAVTLSALTVDFGGGSSPSHFDLWGGGTSGRLPMSIPPGADVVATMTSGFNFDTSDLLGEACHVDSGIVPVVHVTVNGVTTDYRDDHQILNSDGADQASCPHDVSEQTPFTVLNPGDQPAAAPVNQVVPSLTGVATVDRVMSGFAGAWTASPPPSIALQWQRCDSAGANCAAISGATSVTYSPAPADIGSTLRLSVTASNASGSRVLSSAASAVVASGPTVAQMGDISTGFTSDFVTGGTPQLDSTFVAGGSGTTNDFEFFARGAGNTQNFTPEIYAVANGQKGGLLGTGSTITVPKGADGKWYVSSLSGVALTGGSSYVLALDPQDVHNGTYVGAETNGTISEFVDYSTSGTQSSQRLAAGKAATNLKTETTWPGAQDPPYVCCWNQQGQFVTFTFTVPAGETTFVLRYSAGAGPAKRKIELDGSVLAAAETFPATAGWSTWSTVSLNQQLAAGTHTLKVWFDTTAGSTQWLNLDNLTVSQS